MGNKGVKAGQKAEFVREHGGQKLLGEIVCWSTAGQFPHPAVVAGLKGAGLDHEVAKEMLPRHAFSRAAKRLAEERVIDPVNEDHDEIKFQFTKRFLESNEWKYATECYLTLDKRLGRVACPRNHDLEQMAQRELDKAMETRTAADVTKIVQKLFDKEADLFPIRDQGGVYFVPQVHAGFTDKVETFITGLGGRVNRFPVPAHTGRGDKNVQDAVVHGLSALISEHEAAVDDFRPDTRSDTIHRQAEKIKATRVKIEAYAEYLQEKQKELLDAVDASKKKLAERVEALTKERAERPAGSTPGGGNRAFIFGWSVTAVIRWMGKERWGFKQARTVVDHYAGAGVISDATIRAQLLGGRQGERGEPAELTEAEVAEMVGVLTEAGKAAASGVEKE